jgi:hypothetical protein
VQGKAQIFGQRVIASNGTEIGANDFRVSQSGADDDADIDAFSPDVAWDSNANQYLVVWAGEDDTAPYVDGEVEIFAQILDGPTAAEIGADVALSDMGPPSHGDFDAFWPAIADAPGLGMFVVWEGDDSADDRFDEESEIFGQFYAIDSATGVVAVVDAESPDPSWLSATAPNPSAGAFSFSIDLERRTRVRAQLVNVQGRVVAHFEERWVEAGGQTLVVEVPVGRVANGVYFLRVEAGAQRESRKLVLLR